MNEPGENKDWQSAGLNADLLKDLRKYEAQYKIIVYQNGMTLLHKRNFQIGAFALITFCVLMISYQSSNAPYSYIPAFIVIIGQWYIFYLYEKLRATLKSVPDTQDPLTYFRQKRDLLIQVNYLRKFSIGNSIMYFICIWAARSPERLFTFGAISMLIVIGLFFVAVIIHYRIKVIPVVNYLNKVVSHLEKQNNHKEPLSAL